MARPLIFGPCAMLGSYDENAVFSSIDKYGRYAFGQQGKITQWNMARLADCLLPLLLEFSHEEGDSSKEQQALEKVAAVIHQYNAKFETAYYAMYTNKLGLEAVNSDNNALIDSLLAIMQSKGLDYTQTFHRLTQSLTDFVKAEALKSELGDWYETWLCALNNANVQQKVNTQGKTNIQDKVNTQGKVNAAQSLMSKNNPVVIPRNHHVEVILVRCEEAIADNLADNSQQRAVNDDINCIVDEFFEVLRSPYQELESTKIFQDTPKDGDRYYQTFCGT